MGDRGLLRRDPNQPIDIVVVAQCNRDAPHDAPVPRRTARTLLMRQATGLERLFPAIDQGERAFGRPADAPTVDLHPFHPAVRHVGRVKPLRREQRLAEQQRHCRVIIVERVLGWGCEVVQAIREGLPDRLRSHALRRDTQLIAGNQAQQRASSAGDELWVHWLTN